MQAHDGGVYALELARVQDGAPQLVSIGADKTLAIWDTATFKVVKLITATSSNFFQYSKFIASLQNREPQSIHLSTHKASQMMWPSQHARLIIAHT
jgi:hypothetical protein